MLDVIYGNHVHNLEVIFFAGLGGRGVVIEWPRTASAAAVPPE